MRGGPKVNVERTRLEWRHYRMSRDPFSRHKQPGLLAREQMIPERVSLHCQRTSFARLLTRTAIVDPMIDNVNQTTSFPAIVAFNRKRQIDSHLVRSRVWGVGHV